MCGVIGYLSYCHCGKSTGVYNLPTGVWPYNYNEANLAVPCDAPTDVGSRLCPKKWFRKDDCTPGFERTAEFPCSECEYAEIREKQRQQREKRYHAMEAARQKKAKEEQLRLEREQTQDREDAGLEVQRRHQGSESREAAAAAVDDYQQHLMALDAKHKNQWEEQQKVQQQAQFAILQGHDKEEQQELAAAQQALQQSRKASSSAPAESDAPGFVRDNLRYNDDEWDVLLAQNSPDNVGEVVWAHMEAMYQNTLGSTVQHEMDEEETDGQEMDQQEMQQYMQQW